MLFVCVCFFCFLFFFCCFCFFVVFFLGGGLRLASKLGTRMYKRTEYREMYIYCNNVDRKCLDIMHEGVYCQWSIQSEQHFLIYLSQINSVYFRAIVYI